MSREMMSLPEVAHYIGITPPVLVRALCNRGSLDGVPLPAAVENAPLMQRHWLYQDIRQFRRALQRAHHQA